MTTHERLRLLMSNAPQDHGAARLLSIQVVEEGGAGTTYMKVARWGGCKTHAHAAARCGYCLGGSLDGGGAHGNEVTPCCVLHLIIASLWMRNLFLKAEVTRVPTLTGQRLAMQATLSGDGAVVAALLAHLRGSALITTLVCMRVDIIMLLSTTRTMCRSVKATLVDKRVLLSTACNTPRCVDNEICKHAVM